MLLLAARTIFLGCNLNIKTLVRQKDRIYRNYILPCRGVLLLDVFFFNFRQLQT